MKSLRQHGLPKGVLVAFLGLDGSGKSTLIERVVETLQKHDVEAQSKHLHPGLLPALSTLTFRQQESGPVTDPHAKEPSGRVISLIRFLYYWLDYALGYWLMIFPQLLTRRCAFLFDRYFYDYLVDPRRCRVRLPTRLVEFFALLTPSPHLVIVLEAEAEVLYRRKPELPLEELKRQSERLDNVAKTFRNVARVDTSASIDVCHQKIIEAISGLFPTGLPSRQTRT